MVLSQDVMTRVPTQVMNLPRLFPVHVRRHSPPVSDTTSISLHTSSQLFRSYIVSIPSPFICDSVTVSDQQSNNGL